MAEHELNDANVDAVGEQWAGAFVPQDVPSKIDLLELFTVPGVSTISFAVPVRPVLKMLPFEDRRSPLRRRAAAA